MSQVEEEKTEVQAVADELLNQTEQDCDTDIENVKKQFEETFKRTDVLNTRLKADNALMHRGMEKLRSEERDGAQCNPQGTGVFQLPSVVTSTVDHPLGSPSLCFPQLPSAVTSTVDHP
jgi:hypothetical protein